MTAGRALGPNSPIPDKLYFKIGEVAELVGVQTHVLRYWEKEISAIRPTKSTSNQRRYRRKDVELFREVRRLLYEERYTLAGARRRLTGRQPTPEDFEPMPADLPAKGESDPPLEQATLMSTPRFPSEEAPVAPPPSDTAGVAPEPHVPRDFYLPAAAPGLRDGERLERIKAGLRDLIRLAGEVP